MLPVVVVLMAAAMVSCERSKAISTPTETHSQVPTNEPRSANVEITGEESFIFPRPLVESRNMGLKFEEDAGPDRCMHRADLHDGSLHDATCTLHERFLALDHVMRVLELHYARGFDKYCLNFGSRGTDFTHALYRRGYAGLMVDLAHDPANEERFPGVYHFTVPLDAYSVPKVIHSFSVPSNLGVLKVDVDSFDCHILEVALSMLQPAVIIMEVNMMMPPPLMFSKSSFSEHSGRLLNEFLWDTGFWGCSFSYAVRSLRAWGYKLLQLHHIDATFVHESFMAPFEGVSQDTFAWWKHGHLPFVDHERYPQNRHFYFQPFHAAACQQDPGEMLRVFGEAYMAFLKDPRHIDHDATDKAILLGPTATIGLDYFGMRHKTASFAYSPDWRDPADWQPMDEGGPAGNDKISLTMDQVINAGWTDSNSKLLSSHDK